MSELQIKTDPRVESVFENYPLNAKKKIQTLRKLILEVAHETTEVTTLEETLKWGEPSYLTKHGSTVRIDWKKKKPGQYAIYFKCTSKLVATFKTVFSDIFEFENNRAIVFKMGDTVPTEELKACIAAALRYHKVKHLPTLGISEKT